MRKYQPIWIALKAAKVGVVVPVRCHESAVATVIQAVKKEKTGEVADKRRLGMAFAGPMKIEVEKCKKHVEFVVVNFSLEWDGERL